MSADGTARARWGRRGAEGLTIVFSILLALAAESAWSYRADRVEEAGLLASLRVEFDGAASEIETDLAHRFGMLSRMRMVRDARLGSGAPPPVDSVPNVVSALLDWRFYTPAHAILDDAISSGRLELIRSDEVRRSLMTYVQERGRLEVFDERERDFVSARMEPYLMEHLSLDRLMGETSDGASSDEAHRFLAQLSDDAFGGLIEIRMSRTEEAVTFSRVVERSIVAVQSALVSALEGEAAESAP